MAKKVKPEAPIENEEVQATQNEVHNFSNHEKVSIIGAGKFGLKEGKEFKVGGKLANLLIKKGAAKLK